MTDVVRGFANSPLNWPAIIMFGLTHGLVLTLLPWYALTHDFSLAAWIGAAFFMGATGMSITAGYHRLWSHRAYEAHWLVRLPLMLFGAMSLQNSTLIWASLHRVHHKNVDHVDLDPYSIRRGFWFAHMGWMLRDYPSAELDLSNVRDLEKDPLLAFQHKHYLGLALFMNIGMPLLVGAAFGDAWGFLLLGGLLRIVLNHHFTFFINSAAHWWGRRPYTLENSARDNDLISLVTFGEGYHNYHHLFQWDYRNGIRWWQFDPTKWLIYGCSTLGLAWNLKRVPEFLVQRAMLERQFAEARLGLEGCNHHPTRLQALQTLLQHEVEAFGAIMGEWRSLQTDRFEAARKQIADTWENSEVRRRLAHLEESLRMQSKRVRLLRLQSV